jgi:hypothetical protein
MTRTNTPAIDALVASYPALTPQRGAFTITANTNTNSHTINNQAWGRTGPVEPLALDAGLPHTPAPQHRQIFPEPARSRARSPLKNYSKFDNFGSPVSQHVAPDVSVVDDFVFDLGDEHMERIGNGGRSREGSVGTPRKDLEMHEDLLENHE